MAVLRVIANTQYLLSFTENLAFCKLKCQFMHTCAICYAYAHTVICGIPQSVIPIYFC